MTDGTQNIDQNGNNKDHDSVFIQPKKLANKNGELRYTWLVKDFKRLNGLLFSKLGDIKVHLVGQYDDRNRCLVVAHIRANIQLECQSSFEAIDYKIDSRINYCTVTKEQQIDDLDDEYEALLVEEGIVDIREVIEDELILALPLAISKSNEELELKMSFGEMPKDIEEKKNPFTVLEGMNLKA